jgi:hypothetical protein
VPQSSRLGSTQTPKPLPFARAQQPSETNGASKAISRLEIRLAGLYPFSSFSGKSTACERLQQLMPQQVLAVALVIDQTIFVTPSSQHCCFLCYLTNLALLSSLL